MKRILYLTVIALVALSTSSCEMDYPNSNAVEIGSLKAYNLFQTVIYETARNNQELSLKYGGEMMGSTFDGNAAALGKEYVYQQIWDGYSRAAFDATHMAEVAANDSDRFLEAVGYILKVYNMSTLSFLFGDVPYSEAFKGSEGIYAPVFDHGSEIIDAMIADLEKANQLLAKSPAAVKTEIDPIYGENPAKWQRLANSLKLRILSTVTGAEPERWQQIQDILSAVDETPVFSSSEDNAVVEFSPDAPFQSYWGYSGYLSTHFAEIQAGSTMIDLLQVLDAQGNASVTDPRAKIWYRSFTTNGTFVAGTSCLRADILCRADSPCCLMDYAELAFIIAEGMAKGLVTMPYDFDFYYDGAIISSVQRWCDICQKITGEAPDPSYEVLAMVNSALASYDPAVSGKSLEETILTQKYISLCWNGFQQYIEWKRSEYPRVNSTPESRLPYPMLTMQSNGSNANKAIQAMGGSENSNNIALFWSYEAINGSHRNQ